MQIKGRFSVLNQMGSVGAKMADIGRPDPTAEELCALLDEATNNVIEAACEKKAFSQAIGPCAEGQGANQPVDLVLVIDTSGSMQDEAQALSNAAAAAIANAQQTCPSDLRVEWFGIEGTFAGTNFNQTARAFLTGIGVPAIQLTATPTNPEDGAATVVDLARHFNWRPGAARAIFFLGDEPMEGGDPQDAADIAATDAAIASSQMAGVTVFTYRGTGAQVAATINDYNRLAAQTGGQAYANPIANLGGFEAVLAEIICASNTAGCRTADEPDIAPCISLHWGDSKKDQIETDDFEILCLKVSNPYDNVTLCDLTVHLILAMENGQPIPLLPDGTPSVELVPTFQICFGDLGPCTEDEESSASRRLVLRTCGALEGRYQVHIAYCFHAKFTKLVIDRAFTLELCRS